MTWDDDCVHRFQNTQNAFASPNEFVKLWNRPLFVVLFSFPAQFGRLGVIFFMPLLAIVGAYYIYKSVSLLGYKNSLAAIPLYLFQSYHMPISYNALTEPVAACLLAVIFYFFVRRKILHFILLTSLLPLIRLELVLLFPLFIVFTYVYLDKSLIKIGKYCLYLLVPLAVWNMAGYLIDGDLLFLYSRTFGESGYRYYNNVDFFHYINKYVYIVGPTMLFMIWSGICIRLSDWKRSSVDEKFTLACFFFTFCIYIIFSWKLTLGQPAGFLRHLIVLTPFAAVLSLYGINSLLQERRKMISYYMMLVPLPLSVFFFSSYELSQFTKFIYGKPSYENFGVISIWFILFLVLNVKKIEHYNRYYKSIAPFFICFVVISHTLYANPPKAHDSDERRLITDVSVWFNDKQIPYNEVVLSNHPYFFWAGNLNRGSEMFMKVNRKNISKAPVGSFILWDRHYCRKQYTKDLVGDDLIPLISKQKLSIVKGFANFVTVLRKDAEFNLYEN